MSLKRKDPLAQGGLRVASEDPHLVSLGGGRLSTAVTIHHLPIGTFTCYLFIMHSLNIVLHSFNAKLIQK